MTVPMPKLEGHFDGVTDNHAQGWLYSADAPRTRLEVELVSGDRVVARGIANGFRQSLLDDGIGDGKHAFSIPLPAALCDGQAHDLSIREAYTGQVISGGSSRYRSQAPSSGGQPGAANGGPHSSQQQPAEHPSPPHGATPAPLRVQGCLDEVVADRARGWVFSPDAPETRLEVEILCGERVVARGVADLARDDLAGAGFGDGRHGFDLPIDRSGCEGSAPHLSAREAYSRQVLGGAMRPLAAVEQPVPPAQPAAPVSIHGHFDDIVNGHADGWVLIPQQPQRRAEVEILCDGRVVARGLADRFRADLRDAGIGDGHCAFSLAIDASLFDGRPHPLHAREVTTGHTLDGSPKVLMQESPAAGRTAADSPDSRPHAGQGAHPVAPQAPDRPSEQTIGHNPPSAPALHGRLEAVRDGHAEGWVLDPLDPSRRLEIEILCDGQLQGRCAADIHRPDLAEAGIGDGRHAFSLPLGPALFDGRTRWLSAREVGSGLALDGSPLVFASAQPRTPTGPPGSTESLPSAPEQVPTAARPGLEGRLESMANGTVAGWAWDRADPARIVDVEVVSDGRVVARGGASAFRQDLADFGKRQGRCAFALTLEQDLLDGHRHELIARDAASGEPIPGEPLVLEGARSAANGPPPPSLPPPAALHESADPAPAPAAGPELQGRFEGVLNGQATGWVLDPLRPEDRIEIEILCDGVVLARTRADLEREDLSEVTLGDGRHGFRSTLDSALFDGKPHELIARELRTQQVLAGSPQWLQSDTPPPRVRPADVQGAFEAIDGTRAIGFAWDISRPEHRLDIEVLREGEVVARASANTFRRDLYEAGIGDGRHAFTAPLSYELFDGEPHWLTAREAHTGKALTHGPHLFEQPRADWPFDLMPRVEGLRQLEALLAEPEFAARAPDEDWCRRRFVDACLRQEMRRTESARALYRELLGVLGENALCYCKLAETWLLDGEPDPALDAYRRAAALPLPLHWAYLGIGNAFKQREQFVEAEDAYRAALRLRARDPATQARLQEVISHAVPMRVDRLLADGKLDEGIRLLKGRLIEEPQNPMILDKLGLLLARQEGPGQGPGAEPNPLLDDSDDVVAFDTSLRVLELLLADDDAQRSHQGGR